MGPITLIVLAVASCISADSIAGEIPKEDGLQELTESTFEDFIEGHNALVLFYTKDCKECDAWAEGFAKATIEVKNENISVRLGKIDVSKHKTIGEKVAASKYPDVRFFQDGISKKPYRGDKNSKHIVSWLKANVANEINSVTQATELINAEDVVLIGFFNDRKSEAGNAFLDALKGPVRFGITTSEEVMKYYGVEQDSVVIFREGDDKNRDDITENLTKENIEIFIKNHQLSVVTELTEKNAQRVFAVSVPVHFILISSKKVENFQDIMSEFTTTAKEFRSTASFVYMDTDAPFAPTVMSSLSVKIEDCPVVRIVDLKTFGKYKPEDTGLTASVFRNFAQSFVDEKLEPYLGSEDVPADWDKNPVKVLVGKNFEQVTNDPERDVVVLFVSEGPWSETCEKLLPVWDKLGEEYKDNPDLVFARINVTFNEVKGHQPSKYPMVKYYPKGGAEPILFKGENTLEEYQKFIEAKGKYETPPKADKDGQQDGKVDGNAEDQGDDQKDANVNDEVDDQEEVRLEEHEDDKKDKTEL